MSPLGWEPKHPQNTYIVDLEEAQPAFLFEKDPTEADVVDSVVKRLKHGKLNNERYRPNSACVVRHCALTA